MDNVNIKVPCNAIDSQRNVSYMKLNLICTNINVVEYREMVKYHTKIPAFTWYYLKS